MKTMIIAMVTVILLTLSLGMAQAEGCNYAAGILKATSRTELTELQDEASAKCGEVGINAQLIETKPVSVGEAKYHTRQQEKKSWLQKTVDWLVFWD